MNYLQRKKFAFMSIVNQIKGFVRTVLGIPPLTLPDCVDEDSIINYTIDGNSVQDGTPTPENPVEIESVGERTKNLFSEYIVASKGFETHTMINNGVIMHPTSFNSYQSYINFKLGDVVLGGTYTASVGLEWDTTSGAKPMIRFGYVNTSGSFTYLKNGYVSLSGRHNITFTVPEEMPTDMSTSGFTFLVNYTNVKATELVDLTITNIQIEEGTEATEYEPYGKYKIPVMCSGKNLFDKDSFCEYYNSFNHATRKAKANDKYLGEDCFSYYMCYPSATSSEFTWSEGKFKENTQYIFSGYGTYKYASWESRTVAFLAIRYTDGTTALIQKFFYADRFTRFTYTTAENKTIEYLYVANFSTGVPVYLKDFQIEEGTTETDYEPYQKPVTTNIYLDEPLRKVSTYADTVDFKKRIVNRAIKEKIFIGDAAEWWNVWTASATENTVGVYYRNNEELGTYTDQKIVTVVGCSNYFKTTAYSLATQDDSKVGQCCISGTSNPPYIAFKVPFTSKEAWLEWLNGKYIGNEPLKAYWVCKETTETPITLPKLPTFKGTTIYSIDTQIQPSNMSATYYSTAKE